MPVDFVDQSIKVTDEGKIYWKFDNSGTEVWVDSARNSFTKLTSGEFQFIAGPPPTPLG